MDLKAKFNRLQYAGVFEDNHVMPSPALREVHESCDPGPLLYDVANELARYLAEAIVNVEKPLEMINGYDWADGTRELVMKQFVSSLITRFIDGAPDSRDDMREQSILWLGEFLASQTDLAFHHGA